MRHGLPEHAQPCHQRQRKKAGEQCSAAADGMKHAASIGRHERKLKPAQYRPPGTLGHAALPNKQWGITGQADHESNAQHNRGTLSATRCRAGMDPVAAWATFPSAAGATGTTPATDTPGAARPGSARTHHRPPAAHAAATPTHRAEASQRHTPRVVTITPDARAGGRGRAGTPLAHGGAIAAPCPEPEPAATRRQRADPSP